MTTEGVVTILEAVGDSWPAAIVLVALVAGFVAIRALPRLNEIIEGLKAVRHEFTNNSGSTLKDAVDRIEKRVTEQSDALDAHIVEARERDQADQEWKANVEDVLTSRDG